MRTGCQAHAERVDKVLTAGLVSTRIGLGHHINQSMGMGNRPARELWEISLMNTKIKVLSLVLGTAFAGSAAAVCPTSPVPPWTAVGALGGTAVIADGGFAGTECRLDSALTGDTTSLATVQDDSPSAEPRYRAQFIVNTDNLSTLSNVDGAYIFTASQAGGGLPVQLSVVGDGAGGTLVSFFARNTAGSVVAVGSLPLVAGENRIEFDLDGAGATPHFSVWLNNNVEGSPDFTTTTFDNGGATVDTAFLGLAGATPGYFNTSAGATVGFDQFDSRRTTFIGF